MKLFHFKWVSLTFLGVEPNLGFWPETPTGSCWPWSRHHDGQLLTVHCSAPHLCSLPEMLHQLHTFSWAYGWRSATHLTCVTTASCCRMGWWVQHCHSCQGETVTCLSLVWTGNKYCLTWSTTLFDVYPVCQNFPADAGKATSLLDGYESSSLLYCYKLGMTMQIFSPRALAPVRARPQLQIQCPYHARQLGPQLQTWLFHSNPNIRSFLLELDSSCGHSPQPRGQPAFSASCRALVLCHGTVGLQARITSVPIPSR